MRRMSMAKKKSTSRILLCVRNDEYPASLELRKVFQAVPDEAGAARHFVRVVDESGEDYLYPESCFMPIEIPQAAARAFVRAS
jgi:hypothetical protein